MLQNAGPGGHLWINGKKLSYKDIAGNDILDLGLITEFEFETARLIKKWYGNDDRFELRSSGSTGPSKIISATRTMLRFGVELTLETLKLRPGLNAVLCLDTRYTAGIMMLLRCLIGKLNLYAVNPASDPFSSLPDGLEIGFIALVPLQLVSLGKKVACGKFNNNTVILIGGSPLPLELEKKIESFPGNYYQTFGMAETLSHIALRKLNGKDKSDVYTTIGDITVSITYDSRLIIRAPHLSEKEIIANDLVEIIDEKHFLWKGRSDNIINSGGIKIRTEELESEIEKILNHRGYHINFFISSVPDVKLGEHIIMLVEDPENVLSEELLIDLLKPQLPKYNMPREIRCMKRFEYTANGKLDRFNTNKTINPGP